jgi:hypothetical protein
MAKLEIRDLRFEVELKEHELAKIKGGDLPIPIQRVFNQTSLYSNVSPTLLQKSSLISVCPITLP